MKKSIVLFLLMVITGSLYAQTETSKSGSVLWKISGKDLSKPSYLLGTLHLKPGEYLDSISGAIAALQSCEQAVGEVNMLDMSQWQMQMKQVMQMPPDTTYQMLYSDDDYQFVNEKLTSLIGLGLDKIGRLKPADIQLAIMAKAYLKYFPNINPTNILDLRVQLEATKDQKPVLGLETVDDQLYLIFGIMDLQRQADILLCSLKNIDQLMALIPEQISCYDRGDLDKLYQQMEEDGNCPPTPSEKDALNKDRNNAWMLKLPEIMREKSSFIAVGAGHLAGEEGLLNQLENAGYTVEAVMQ
ncbi:MAG: TraB/GumN family protein [Candidatus Azobacteroides sp.]|nr:TraB/GumN family protein [Candidatus Azobacteroides sp.]